MRAIVFCVVLIAGPALAQQAPPADAPVSTAVQSPPAQPDSSAQIPEAIDPLADLIAQSGQTTDEEEEVEAAADKPAPRRRPTILPIPPPEPEAPAGAGGYLTTAQVYELRVKGSVAAAQNLQGPLDGGWKVAGPDGAQLYALQIVDKAGGYGELEGAWRDVRRAGAVGSTGLIDDLRRDGAGLVARFSPRAGQSSTLTLRPLGEASWTGELVENGQTQAVVAEHAVPQAPPGYEGQGRGPYVWPPRAAAPSRPASAPACSTKGKKGKALKAAKAKCAAAAKKKGAAVKKGKAGKAKATAKKRKKR